MSPEMVTAAFGLLKRAADETEDPEKETDSSQKEIFSSWALFISIMLLITAFFASYMLQQKKVQAVHETVVSIFAGMIVGLTLRVTAGNSIRDLVSFDYQIFFNLLLPPIILNSGYELHQANFFRNIGTILTFAFAGTFMSAVVIGSILWLYTKLPIEALDLTFVDAISVGATLSATDPVTILAIFTTYKVDPKLYTIIFGESILNDAIAIVIFETAQTLKKGEAHSTGILSLFEGIGIFLAVFFGSLLIGIVIGVLMALILKYTYLRRFPKIESCLVVLIAYVSYFFSQGMHMSGIVSLLFCGITLKHYAYFNMSRRTQLSTKYFFQVLAQLSENFIFIYLGLSLFTDPHLLFQPLLIIVTVTAVCAARWVAVFPLSKAINWFLRYRARRRGKEVAEELPYNYQCMLFWAGLRGAVGVALAALLTGENSYPLKATVLVVVVLTVIIFGGTTARMLEILDIRTGVVEELDSDDEFDIEAIGSTGSFYKRSGGSVGGIGFNPRRTDSTLGLDPVARGGSAAAAGSNGRARGAPGRGASYASGTRPIGATRPARKNSRHGRGDFERADLLGSSVRSGGSGSVTDNSDFGSDIDTSDLPPPARRTPTIRQTPLPLQEGGETITTSTPGMMPLGEGADVVGVTGQQSASAAIGAAAATAGAVGTAAAGALRTLLTSQDHAALFRQLDEDFIKPKLLLDGGGGGGGSGSGGQGGERK